MCLCLYLCASENQALDCGCGKSKQTKRGGWEGKGLLSLLVTDVFKFPAASASENWIGT